MFAPLSSARRWLTDAFGSVKDPSTILGVLGPFRDSGYLLSADGSLSVVLAYEGRDPDGLLDADFAATALALRQLLTQLPHNVRIQEFYIHSVAKLPRPRQRRHAVIDALEGARHQHLSSKTLYRSRLFFVLTLPTAALASRIPPIDMLGMLLLAPVDADARRRLARLFAAPGQLRFLEQALHDGARQLSDVVSAVSRRLSLFSDVHQVSVRGSWGLARCLASGDTSCLDDDAPAPPDYWSASVLRGAVRACTVGGLEHLFSEHRAIYSRLASVVRIAGSTKPGLWCSNHPSLLSLPGEYVLALTASPLSGLQRSVRFTHLRNEVSRRDLNLLRALSKDAQALAPTVRSADELELDAAEALDERFWNVHIVAAAWGADPSAVKDVAHGLDHACAQASVSLVWETPGAFPAYRATQLASTPYASRSLLLNSSQFGAVSLAYRHSQGVSEVVDLGGEEPLIWLETIDGQPFGFSPFVGQKSTVLGLGASRSGKTFAKNVLAAAWAKWGGQVVTMDYDAGSTCLARLYGEDAGHFAGEQGLNPFSAVPESLNAFRAHMTRLTLALIRSNDDPAMRELAPGEQALMDAATDAVLALPPELRSLSSWAGHLPATTRSKLVRWLQATGGRYADLLDSATDSVGLIEHMMTVFNLAHLRDDDTARAPVLLELLWRVTQAFESPARLLAPQKLIIDEAHYSMRGRASIADVLVTKARTWAKFRASLELWTHIPSNYGDIPEWEALRSSASTFLFTATPDADIDQYVSIFGLTPGDVDQIRTMVPKRDLYLVQPDIGLRKRLILDPDAAALEWASSTASVVAARSADRSVIAA